MDIPDSVIKRIAKEDKKQQPKTGIQMCVEMIEELKQVEGVRGVHVMAIEWERKVPEIVSQAGLLPRPMLS